MPRSGGNGKQGDQTTQQGTERVASPDRRRSDDEDSDTDILETNENGRYQKMIEQVKYGFVFNCVCPLFTFSN